MSARVDTLSERRLRLAELAPAASGLPPATEAAPPADHGPREATPRSPIGLLRVAASWLQLGITVALLAAALYPAALVLRFAFSRFGAIAAMMITPAAYALWGASFCLMVVALKRLTFARTRPGSFPFFSVVVARWAFVTQLSKVAHQMFLVWVMGTDFIVWWYRLLGAKIGQRVTINTVFVYDWDMLEIGSDTFVGGRSTLMAHVGQLGRVTFAPTKIGEHCTIGQDACVFPGVVMEGGAVLGANSLAMEWQHLGADKIYLGVPARFVRHAASNANGRGQKEAGAPVLLDRNESQHPPAPGCMVALREIPPTKLIQYSREDRLAERLAGWLGVEKDSLVLGAGSEGLLKTAFHRLVAPGDRVLLPEPSWSYYARLASEAGATVCPYAVREEAGRFAYDVEDLLRQADGTGASLVVLASPNNPTGNSLSYDELQRVLGSQGDTPFILDEAYWGFRPIGNGHVRELLDRSPNLFVLRTFSKFFGLPGIRLGFGAVGKNLARLASAAAVYLGHNRISEQVALAALDDPRYYRTIAAEVEREKQRLIEGLAGTPGVTCYASDANFVLVRLAAGAWEDFRERTRRAGILLKFFGEGVLAGCVRITLGAPEHNATLLGLLLTSARPRGSR